MKIVHNRRRGSSRQECIDEPESLLGVEAACHSTATNWFNKFNRGRRSLKDKVRKGRPKTNNDRQVTFLSPAYIRYCINTWLV